ncbi:MAG: VWA domain-containing protein [Kofleriaceae bacterium]|nr:VWA domain-containing protein [Kofleriaceae bacterium]
MSIHEIVGPLEFREPLALLFSLTALLIVLAALWPSGKVIFSSFHLLPPDSKTWRTRLLWVPTVLLGGAAVTLGVALAGPRLPDRSQRIEREGIAIMMAIDTSGSMRALDLSEGDEELTRLDAVKKVFESFIKGEGELRGRPDDAIGIVRFAGFADTRCPLTLDHDVLLKIASTLEIVTNPRENGTALGDGLGLAVERLRGSEAKSKIIILLTDGVNEGGEVTPLAAAELAAAEDIKVYTIGAGTRGQAFVRAPDPFTGRQVLRQVEVRIDEETLQAIADRTGGRYFRATDAEALKEVYSAIDDLERTDLGEERFREFTEYYRHFTALALLFAALAWLLSFSVFRRLP